MAPRHPVPAARLFIRIPLLLLFLYLAYLLAGALTGLIRAYSVSLGLSSSTVTVLCTLAAGFISVIVLLAAISLFRNARRP